jgi:two-component system OmpR family response regulator
MKRQNPTKKVLVIDDDKEITLLVSDYLAQHGYTVICAHHGHKLSQLLDAHSFDLVILDVMLPGKDGLTLCQEIRQTQDMPILMLSAANTEADRVAGLELGADDYISKPFSARELLARVKAHIRRAEGEHPASRQRLSPLHQLQFGHLTLNRENRCLVDAESIATPLSQREYDLLTILLEHPRRILSRDQLTDLLYDKVCDPFDRTIDVLIARLRKKIEIDPKNPQILMTVRGGGYKLESDVKTL